MNKYKKLFEPQRVGKYILKNRFLMTPIKLGYATLKGEVTERHVDFYSLRASGSVALITTEPLYISTNGKEIPKQMGIYGDELIGGLEKITKAVHREGALIMAHINHAGRVANPKLTSDLISASEIACPSIGQKPRELSPREVWDYIGLYVKAAFRAKEAGFDGVEVQFGHGYLIHQFLSYQTNKRRDEFGDRMKFGMEILKRIRKQWQEGIISVRLNGSDFVKDGMDIEDAIKIAEAVEDAGADMINVTGGSMCGSVGVALYSNFRDRGFFYSYAQRIKKEVSLPVATVGRLNHPDYALEIIEKGIADICGLGRPLVADPFYPQKALEGKIDEIMPCAACHQGCLAQLRKGESVTCMINPSVGRAVKIERAKERKYVMVIGGGPGGMEIAVTAAQRGHRIKLYEKKNLGGQLFLAKVPPHKRDFELFIKYFKNMLSKYGVEVVREEATIDSIKKENPDVVVCASGGKPLVIDFPGLSNIPHLNSWEALEGESLQGKEILIIGGGSVGLETAYYFVEKGMGITVIEMLPSVGNDLDALARAELLNKLKEKGVKIYTDTKLMKFEEGKAVTEQKGEIKEFKFSWVILSLGTKSNNSLCLELERNFKGEFYTLGDAKRVAKAFEAIQEGFEIGRSI